MVAPFIVWIGFCLAFSASAWFEKKWKQITTLHWIRRVEAFAMITFTSMYTIVIAGLFSTVKCQQQPDGSFTLIDNSSIRCFDGEWKDKHLGAIIFFAVLYLLILPMWLFTVFLRFSLDFQRRVYQQRSVWLPPAEHLAFVHRSFKRKYFWWIAVDMLKKVAIIAFSAFLSGTDDSKTANYLATLILLIVYLLIDVTVMEYATDISLRVALLWNSVALIMLLSDALMFKATSISESVKTAFSAVLIACVCCSTLIALTSKLPCVLRKTESLDLSDAQAAVAFKDPNVNGSEGSISFSVNYSGSQYHDMKSKLLKTESSEISIHLRVKNLHSSVKTANTTSLPGDVVPVPISNIDLVSTQATTTTNA
jgi:hypothetical protein